MADASLNTVPSSFATPPNVANQFRERFMQSEAAQAAGQSTQTPGQSTQTPQTMESQHVDRGGSRPVQPNPLDAQPKPEPVQPPVQPQPAQSAPQPYYDPALVQQLARERDALWQQVNQYAAEREQWARQQNAKDMTERLMQSPELQELESVDPEDARRIAAAALQGASSQYAQLQQDLNALRAEQQRSYQELRQRERAQFDKKNAENVLQVHPDFFDLYNNSAEFRQFLNGHDGYSSKSREQMATEEFYAGNTAFVVDLLNRFKQGQPNSANVSTVAPVQVASSAATAGTHAPAQPSYTLADLNNLMQTRQISHDEYLKRLGEWKAANPR